MNHVLIASPPTTAVGGVARHTALLSARLPDARVFDQWWPLPRRSQSRPLRLVVHLVGAFRWLTALVWQRPRVVHLQMSAPGARRDLLYLRVADLLNIPVVAHVHTSGFFDELTPDSAADHALDVTLDRAKMVLVMSDPVAEHVRARRPDRAAAVRVLPNPASDLDPPPRARTRDGHPVRVLTVGEINELKQMSAILEVIEGLRRDGLEVDYHVVGPWGPLPRAQREHLESSDAVTLHGVRRGGELTRSYDEADIFVLFSRNEAEPLSLLEAMTRALPVIAPNVGSIPATLGQVPGNAVVPVGDVDALREALRHFIERPALRELVGGRNREWVLANRSPEDHLETLARIHDEAARADPGEDSTGLGTSDVDGVRHADTRPSRSRITNQRNRLFPKR